MVDNSVALIQFAKRPISGLVKTRLIPALGEQQAAMVHRQLMELTLKLLCDTKPGQVQLWWDLAWDDSEFISGLKLRQTLITAVQSGGDLGNRMYQALRAQLEHAGKVILVGSDCPVLSADYLEAALSQLDSHDIVLGPAEDGGFVLIGARRLAEGCLTGIVWGVGSVLEETKAKAESFGLSVGLLEPLWDVDVLEDYQRWLAIRSQGD